MKKDSLQNILWHFMSLLTLKFVKNSLIQATIDFIFLENILNKLEIVLIPNFDLSKKIRTAFVK